LAKRGYTLGQNLVYEARGAAGKHDQLPRLMQELKAADVGVVLTVGYPAAVTAKGSGIPTVIAGGAGDPVATGLVESLARPGGTVTGISDNAAMLSTKRLGLLKEVSPQLRRVAMLWNKDDLAMSLRYEASARAAQGIGVTVQSCARAERLRGSLRGYESGAAGRDYDGFRLFDPAQSKARRRLRCRKAHTRDLRG
jgi:putative ABC transport system substrate-binding protein